MCTINFFWFVWQNGIVIDGEINVVWELNKVKNYTKNEVKNVKTDSIRKNKVRVLLSKLS